MCVMSMVFDHYEPKIPHVNPGPQWVVPMPRYDYEVDPDEVKRLRELIKEFREGVAAAKKVDALTGQPDCEDPKKAQVEKRAEQVAAVLDRGGSFTVTEPTTLEPGRYAVVDGKLYREVV